MDIFFSFPGGLINSVSIIVERQGSLRSKGLTKKQSGGCQTILGFLCQTCT